MVSLTIFIELLSMLNFKYKSSRPMTSFDSGKAWTSITLFGLSVDVMLIVVKFISPFKYHGYLDRVLKFVSRGIYEV